MKRPTAPPPPPNAIAARVQVLETIHEWEPPTVPKLSDNADVVVAFSLGTGPHVGPKANQSLLPGWIHPGASNKGLAHTVLRMLQDNPKLHVYAQWEIGDVITGFSYHAGAAWLAAAAWGARPRALWQGLGAVNKPDPSGCPPPPQRCIERGERAPPERCIEGEKVPHPLQDRPAHAQPLSS